ncbi:MAG TPA: hypothetical protein VK669_13480, partial [Candidatus Limnocylindrales bacterium]|nr:hypothetical protein [Candidatus Limnocylindrales bacterium]
PADAGAFFFAGIAMLIVIVERCAEAADPPPPFAGTPGTFALAASPCAGGTVDDPPLPQPARARLKTAPAARSLMFMAPFMKSRCHASALTARNFW